MSEVKLKKSYIEILLLLAILIFPAFLFGFTGLKTALGFFVVLVLPIYLIMKPIDIEKDEKIFFSFFLGIIYFPLLTWYVNRIVPSLKVSTLITFAVFVFVFILINNRKGNIKFK